MRLSMVFFVVVLLGLSVPANADIQTYTSETDFFSASQIISTETFDEFVNRGAFNSPTITLNGIVYNTTALNGWATEGPPYFYPHSLPLTLIQTATNTSTTTLSFGEGRYVEAFGLWVEHWSVVPGPVCQINVIENGGAVTVVDVIATSWPWSGYYGFVSDTGIQTITFTPVPRRASWCYDNVSHSGILGGSALSDNYVYSQYGAPSVPVPPTILLLASGLFGLIGLKRKIGL